MPHLPMPNGALRRLGALVGALLVLAAPLAPAALAQTATTPAASANAQSEARANTAPKTDLADLEDEVMCVQCKRPLVTSAGSAADDQRELMQQWINEGLTKDEIKARLVDEYGDRALVDDRSGIAAAAPWLAAVIGAVSIGLLLRRRRLSTGDPREAAGDAPPAASNGHGPASRVPELSAADDARIDAELAELDGR